MSDTTQTDGDGTAGEWSALNETAALLTFSDGMELYSLDTIAELLNEQAAENEALRTRAEQAEAQSKEWEAAFHHDYKYSQARITELEGERDEASDLNELAWGLIANVHDWDAVRHWRGAAERWRERYFKTLPDSGDGIGPMTEIDATPASEASTPEPTPPSDSSLLTKALELGKEFRARMESPTPPSSGGGESDDG